MAAPGNSPIAIAFEGISGTGSIPTPVLLAGMLRASEKVSDLIFSPGRPPQVEIHGQLTAVEISGSSILSADDTRRIAADLIGTISRPSIPFASKVPATFPTDCREWRASASMSLSSAVVARS